ncbi:hypothetical protein MRB53_015449 [Persea americana]|uniref:Uncharacterized protein n=1 Tax=Persea americana TaxID=3435 RepID=A0ACC2KDW2_PERAE|nr:hypothetical protein MRB53_015449 [Persea americana]
MILLHVCHVFNSLEVDLLPENTRFVEGQNLPHAAPACHPCSTRSTCTSSLAATVARERRCSQQPLHCVHTVNHIARRLHTPRAAQHVVHISHCTTMLCTDVHSTSDRKAILIHTNGSICNV